MINIEKELQLKIEDGVNPSIKLSIEFDKNNFKKDINFKLTGVNVENKDEIKKKVLECIQNNIKVGCYD